MIVLAVLALLAAWPAVAVGQAGPEEERLFLEGLLDRGFRRLAEERVARLRSRPDTSPAMRRVVQYIDCRLLHDRFRLRRASTRVRTELARQAVSAFRGFLATAGRRAIDLRARFGLALLLQQRARWRLEMNEVLHAAAIDRDLTESSRWLREVFRPGPDDGRREVRWLRLLARLQFGINLYLKARLYSPADVRHLPTLTQAIDYLVDFAWEHDRYFAGQRAYFYYGRCEELNGEPTKAAEVYEALLQDVPWNTTTAPLLEEAAYHLCRLDARRGRPRRVVRLVTWMKLHLGQLQRRPGRHAVMAAGEAALARAATWGPAAAADAFEADAAWFARTEAPAAGTVLPVYAARLARAVRPVATPERHAALFLMAARGLLRAGRTQEALTWSARLARAPTSPPAVRQEAWSIASRAWERRGFLREAARAAELSTGPGPPTPERARRLAQLRRALAARSSSRWDRRRYDEAAAAAPRVKGRLEYEAGRRAYERGRYPEALAALTAVDPGSRFYPLAVAYAAHVRYLLGAGDPAGRERAGREILGLLGRLDRLPAASPNLLPALALRSLTQALVRKDLGNLAGALDDLAGYEDRFPGQPSLVAEALKLRAALHLERADEARAGEAVALLGERFPRHRACGEACLILGRHLRSCQGTQCAGGGRERTDPRFRRSVALRHRSLAILGPEFPARDLYVLAVDEMTLANFAAALRLLESLARRDPPELRDRLDGMALRRVRCLMELGRLAEARRTAEALLRRRPDHLKPLKLYAVLLGGTLRDENGVLTERRYLHAVGGKQAFAIWQRIEDHAARQPGADGYGPLWFEAKLHLALLAFRAGRSDFVRRILDSLRASGYENLGGERFAPRFRWLEERL